MHISANIICKQLKDFVQYKEYNPEIGDSYFATSEKDEDTDDNILKPCIGILIILFFIVGSFLVILITLILMVIYLYTKRWDRKLTKISESIKSNKASKSKIVGIAFTSWILYIYIVILDLLAVNTKHTSIQVPDMLPVLLIIVLVVDCIAMFIIICALVCILSIIICSLCDCCKKRKDEKRYSLCKLYKKSEYLFLALSTLGPMLSLLIHIPYIAIAFLNDAYHASSIFVAYTVIAFILFGAVELTYGTCQRALIESKYTKIKLKKILFEEKLVNLMAKRVSGNGSIRSVRLDNVKIAFNSKEETALKLEYYLTIKEQKLKIDSITITSDQQPQEWDTFKNNLSNAKLDIEHNISDGESDQVTRKCTTKYGNDQTSQSSVELLINKTVKQLEVTAVTEVGMCIKLKEATLDIQGGKLLELPNNSCLCCAKTNWHIICIFGTLIPSFVVILLLLIAMVTAVLVTIPVHNAFSDAPNRLVGFYQIVVVFVGAYVLYRSFFKRQPTIETAVEDRMEHVDPNTEDGNDHDKWKQLSKEERVAEFYTRVVDIVAKHKT